MPERGDVHDVRVERVDTDLRDVARLGEAEVSPGLASIVRAVNAVAMRDVAADARLAHADVDHARFSCCDGDRPDRSSLEEGVADVLPVDAGVIRAPYAAAR